MVSIGRTDLDAEEFRIVEFYFDHASVTDNDWFSQSDPVAELTDKNNITVARTFVINEESHPGWHLSIRVHLDDNQFSQALNGEELEFNLSLYDQDRVGRDAVDKSSCKVKFPGKDIQDGRTSWKPLHFNFANGSVHMVMNYRWQKTWKNEVKIRSNLQWDKHLQSHRNTSYWNNYKDPRPFLVMLVHPDINHQEAEKLVTKAQPLFDREHGVQIDQQIAVDNADMLGISVEWFKTEGEATAVLLSSRYSNFPRALYDVKEKRVVENSVCVPDGCELKKSKVVTKLKNFVWQPHAKHFVAIDFPALDEPWGKSFNGMFFNSLSLALLYKLLNMPFGGCQLFDVDRKTSKITPSSPWNFYPSGTPAKKLKKMDYEKIRKVFNDNKVGDEEITKISEARTAWAKMQILHDATEPSKWDVLCEEGSPYWKKSLNSLEWLFSKTMWALCGGASLVTLGYGVRIFLGTATEETENIEMSSTESWYSALNRSLEELPAEIEEIAVEGAEFALEAGEVALEVEPLVVLVSAESEGLVFKVVCAIMLILVAILGMTLILLLQYLQLLLQGHS